MEKFTAIEPIRNRLIRRAEVKHITGFSDSALDRAFRAGEFPKPVQLIPGAGKGSAVGWSENAVLEWVERRIKAAGNE